MRYGVLGPFEALDDGSVLDIGRPKQRAVLAVLILADNRVVSLDRLIDLLWGDERPARATASLQVYVSNLRRVLEPGRDPDRPWTRLLTRPPGYLLRVGPGELDAARFESLAAEGRRLLAGGQPLAARRALDEALGLWRGDALADFSYEKFARPAVARWEELRQVVTEDRIQADLELGGHGPAVATLEGLVARFPLRERLWGLLMVALYRDARQGDALRTYARARALLTEELGVGPGPELRRLEADILVHAPMLEWQPGPDDEAPPPIVVTPSERPPASGSPPLVGRSAALARLDAALEAATAGQGRTVLISGEPGIGKTRLGEELAALAAAAGAAVAWGGSNEGEGAPAFWPWVEVLRAVLGTAGTGGPGASWLAQLVPYAAVALGSPAPPPAALDGESARFRLHQAIMDALAGAAAERPLVVVLDDLHWADAASCALCEFVAARLHGTGILLVATFRPAELFPGHPLVATLAAFARLPALTRLSLDGLTVAEVGRFVELGWAVAPSAELAAALHARTDGNPFFLTELVKLLASEGSLGRADAVAAAGVPAGVRDVLRRRLGRLPEATNALLRVAAVAGRSFDLGVLIAATGYDEDWTLEAVEGALVTGVVVEDPVTVGRYRFAHTLLQQTLYDELSAMRRARLHARVGAAIESTPADDARWSELAQHFYRAVPAIGPEKAVAYALEAASAAQTRLAYESVEEHLGRALELLEQMPAGSDRDRRELQVQNRLALSLMVNGGLVSPAAARACDRAAELALRLGDTGELRLSMAGLSKAAIVRAEWGVVSGLGTRMVALGEASDDPLSRAAGLFALGNVEFFVGDHRQSRRHIEQAIALARPLWKPSPDAAFLWVNPLVFALTILGLGLTLAGEDAAAAEALDEAEELANAAGHQFWLVGVLLCRAISHTCAGRAAEARVEAERCSELGRGSGLRVVFTITDAIRTWATAGAHPGPEELAQLRADLAVCDAEGVRMWRPFRLALLADASLQAQRWDEAVAATDEGLAQCEAYGERVCEAELHRLRGLALAAAAGMGAGGATDEAEASLRRAVSVAQDQGATLFVRRATDCLERLAGGRSGASDPDLVRRMSRQRP